jgi:hypothetical protein
MKAATSSPTSSFCAPEGERCSDNDEYCGNSENGGRFYKWASCQPPLSERWTLVRVRVTASPATKAHEAISNRG